MRIHKWAAALCLLAAGGPAAAAPAAGLLPAGFLHTRGSQIVGPDGVPVRITSVGVAGLDIVGGRLELVGPFKGVAGHVAAMKAAGFNCARVDWMDKTLDDAAALAQLDLFVAECRRAGLKIIFNNHNNEATAKNWSNAAQQSNGLWFDTGPGTDGTDGGGDRGTVSASRFAQDWVRFARRWAGNPTVIGFDLRNEPCAHTATPALWGGGGPTDIRAMYQDVGNQVLAVDPGALIICESVINYKINAYEGDLSVARTSPVVLRDPSKLVYSVHEYPKEIGGYAGAESGPEYVARMNKTWGWLVSENVAPVWIGEMGSSMKAEGSKAWGETLLSYMNGEAPNGPKFEGNKQGISGDWWIWGNLSDQVPDGCLAKDGGLRPEQAPFIAKMRPRAKVLPRRRAAAALAAPPGLSATPAFRQVTLDWSASIGAAGYDICRGTAAGGEGAVPIARNVTGPPYVDTGLENGTRYHYIVRAVSATGPGDASEAFGTPSASAEAGYYLVTYWAGNSAPLVADDNGNYTVAGSKRHDPRRLPGGPAEGAAKITATFTYQPNGEGDAPPSAVILMTGEQGGGQSSRHYSARNDPGASFSVTDTPAAPADHKPSPAHAPAPSPPAPGFTPYQTNPDLFAGRTEALRALQSPDVLLRRSGVEWLGDWTQTRGSGGPPGRETRRQKFSRMASLVPALTRAVGEMPDEDSRQAARLIALLGPAARPAIPALCAALASAEYAGRLPGDIGNSAARDDLLDSLTRLCGGPDALAPTLTALLHDRDPKTRRAAAAALRFCDRSAVGMLPTPWHRAFLATVIPAMAASLDDDADAVRLAAAQSLEQWTYFPDAPWALALAPLSRASSSTDAALRLAALRTLALMPGDVSPAAPALRAGLSGDEAGRPWALAALSHAAWTGRARTVDAFLTDLAAPDVAQRRAAAADLSLTAGLLWGGDFQYPSYPLPQWWNDSRLFGVSAAPDATAPASKIRLLDALVGATADHDATVRRDAAAGLEQLGEAADRAQNGRRRFFGASTETPMATVMAALTRAASFLQETDPVSAKRLDDLKARLNTPRMSF